MIPYSQRRGGHSVAVIVIPKVIGMRFVHYSKDSGSSWTIRDYIGGNWMEGSENQHLTAKEIESEPTFVVPSEDIPSDSIRMGDFWNSFLTELSQDYLGNKFDIHTLAAPMLGKWKRMPTCH